jgi:hypothetical protein
VVREQVLVHVGFNDEINVSVAPAARRHSVQVTPKNRWSIPKTPTLQQNVSRIQLNNLANSHEIWLVTGITTGMTVKSNLDVGGTAAETEPTYTSYAMVRSASSRCASSTTAQTKFVPKRPGRPVRQYAGSGRRHRNELEQPD